MQEKTAYAQYGECWRCKRGGKSGWEGHVSRATPAGRHSLETALEMSSGPIGS